MKQNKNGFTLMEMLIVIAIIAVLIAVAIPVFASQLEKAREATDLANVRSAYAQVSTEALLGDSEATVTVNLKQKQADWQSVDPVNIGGIVHSKSQGDTKNWIGVAAPNGTWFRYAACPIAAPSISVQLAWKLDTILSFTALSQIN